MTIVAFLGVSGVGKTKFLKDVQTQTPFRHLQASELIKAERKRSEAFEISSEQLRTGDIPNNQELLLRAFLREPLGVDDLVVLDGHGVIDTPAGLVEIPSSVFHRIGVAGIAFLRASGEEILRRRNADSGRSRPDRSIDQIEDYQDRAVQHAARVAHEMRIPFLVLESGHAEGFCAFLEGLGTD